MSTEWLTIKLKSEQVVVPPSRTKMIELVRKGEHNPEELEIGDFNDKVVNDFWNKYHFPPTDNRAEKLTKLRIQQIKELRELVKHLDQELYKYQRDSRTVPSRTNRSSSSTSSGDSWSGAVTRGVVQGCNSSYYFKFIVKASIGIENKLSLLGGCNRISAIRDIKFGATSNKNLNNFNWN